MPSDIPHYIYLRRPVDREQQAKELAAPRKESLLVILKEIYLKMYVIRRKFARLIPVALLLLLNTSTGYAEWIVRKDCPFQASLFTSG